MKFTHHGIEIELTSGGAFTAIVKNKRIVKPSLDAMKKAIDSAAKSKFKAFTALVYEDYKFKGDKHGIAKVTVTGIESNGLKGWRKGMRFTLERDGRTGVQRSVYADSDASRDALVALQEHKRETKKIREQREKEEEQLRAKLISIDADNYK